MTLLCARERNASGDECGGRKYKTRELARAQRLVLYALCGFSRHSTAIDVVVCGDREWEESDGEAAEEEASGE